MICPDCKTDNIPGVDFCESCGHDLRNLDLPGADDELTQHLLQDRVGDIAMKETRSVTPRDPVTFAVHVMQRYKTGCVLVLEDDQLVGIMTDRDVLLKAAGEKMDLTALTVAQLMTPDPIALREDDTLAVALHKMSVGGFRHLPVLSEGQPPRVLSIRDLFGHVSDFIHSAPTAVS